MSAGDCICPGEELTFEGLTVSCVFSLVDLTVSPMTWNNVTGCYPKSLLTLHGLSLERPNVVSKEVMLALLKLYFINSFEMKPPFDI